MESQLTRPDHIETPIKIHHAEEEERHEKGTTKVIQAVKEKAGKIKNTLTKHGHDDDDDDDVTQPEVHGAPMYESTGVTGQPESLSHPGKAHIPTPEEIVPPGTRVFPVVSSVQTEPVGPVRVSEPVRGLDSSHGFGELTHPKRASGLSDREESREAQLTPHNTPVSVLSGTEDVTRTFLPDEEDPPGQRKVNLERPKGLEEDPAAPGGGFGSSGVASNYQTKVTDSTGKSGEEVGVTPIIESLGKMNEISGPGLETESPTRIDERNVKSGHEDLPTKRHDPDVKTGHKLGKNLPTGSHDQFSPELSPPKPLENPGTEETGAFSTRAMADDEDMPKQSIYTEKIVSATSAIADKAAAARNAVASKVGYSSGRSREEEGTPRSAVEYGKKMAGTVAEKLTPVYEKVKETGTSVMTKMPLSGGGEGETEEGQDKGVSAREYLAEKLKPGEEDKALSEVISQKLHLRGDKKKKTETVTELEKETKSAGTVQESSSQSLGSAIGKN